MIVVIASCDWTHLWLQMVLITRYSLLRYLTSHQSKSIPLSINVRGNIPSAPNLAMENGSVFLTGLTATFSVLCFSICLATCAM